MTKLAADAPSPQVPDDAAPDDPAPQGTASTSASGSEVTPGSRSARRGQPELSTIARLRDAPPREGARSWLITGAITLLAFVIRVINLGYPNYLVFDETYYAKDAYALLTSGYERDWPSEANTSIVAGTADIMKDGAAFVVHPPLGKWLIALGEQVFGMNAFGWRISACVFGALLVLMTIRLARRLARSTLVGAIAGILLTFDGLAFVMSRIALLDIFQAFFLVAGVAALVADRDWFRAKLADRLTGLGRPDLGGAFGPLVFGRPWRWVAGLMFGCALATKWNSVYVLAVFGLLSVLWDVGARRLAGADFRSWLALLYDGIPAFIALVLTAAVTYLASWTGWFTSAGGWDRQWGATHPDDPLVSAFGPDLASWLWYHKEIYNFHTGSFINQATHPYAANPAGWLFMIRPIGIDAVNDIAPGTDGCVGPGNCIRVISGMGTPVLWWLGVAALVVAVIWWIGGRDWRFGVPVLGLASVWLPWFQYTSRPLFFFYAVAIIPFTVIALALVLGLIIGPAHSPTRRRGAIIAGTVVALVVLNFGYLYPVLTDQLLPYSDWLARMWLRSWI